MRGPSAAMAALLVVTIVCLIGQSGVDCGEVCRRKDLNGNDEIFECPRLFESSKKRFCCGQTPSEKYCCAWSKKSKDLITPDVKSLFESLASIIIMILLVIGGLIVCCCVCACCLLQRKHKRRGRVLNPSHDATSVTTMTSPPNSVAYPVQPNAYPMHNVATPYPPDQPPPYSFEQTQPPYNPSYPTK